MQIQNAIDWKLDRLIHFLDSTSLGLNLQSCRRTKEGPSGAFSPFSYRKACLSKNRVTTRP
jgi:hypothetical protein